MKLLIVMLRSQKEEVVESAEEVDEATLWSDRAVEEAPEDLATPQLYVFEPVLKFMEVAYKEAKAEYFESLKSHLGKP